MSSGNDGGRQPAGEAGPLALGLGQVRGNGSRQEPPEKGRLVLVTGGAGYIGCVLTRRLLDRGYRVRVLDRLLWGEEPLADLLEGIELVAADVRDIPATALDGVGSVIHLAGLSNDPTAEYDPEANWQMNALATEALGKACVERGIERLVFASSCSLYDGSRRDARRGGADPAARRLRHLEALWRGEAARARRGRPLRRDPAQRHGLRLLAADALRPRRQHLRQGRLPQRPARAARR